MEIIKEVSERSREKQFWLVLSVAALCVWLGMEVKTILNGKISILGLGYIGFFAIILIWKFAFRYTCILTDKSIITISHWFFIRRTFEVELSRTESYSNKYIKSFFKKTGIRGYAHRESAFDGRPKRIFVYNKNGKMYALLFKASDAFIEKLKQMMPEKFLDLEEKKP